MAMCTVIPMIDMLTTKGHIVQTNTNTERL